ncbi:MAG: DNA/RNA helicase domain-containing protein [Rhodoblastus sp.]|uniref:DNA/RNA helicase domain-containing protein n=1 Tax=Rhodoblastus sp. TaxID=1962975 RepID=UPI003F95784A
MRAPRWQIIRETEKKRFRLNGYRVLLTRARAGLVIFIPKGTADDPTRSPFEADMISETLIAAGCGVLD